MIVLGDCRETMRGWIAEGRRAQMCVTSPPYWGLRDYGVAGGQLGLEPTIAEYVSNMVDVFRLVRDVLADDGTLWLNLGDSYAGSWGAQGRNGEMSDRSVVSARQIAAHSRGQTQTGTIRDAGIKAKDLCGIPWRVAFALQADGWWLRQDIIWSKPNPMPESVTDRCTKAHEYLFLLSKRERYYFDADAIAERVTDSTVDRLSQPTLGTQIGSARVPGKTNGNMKAVGKPAGDYGHGGGRNDGNNHPSGGWCEGMTRNKRSVWTVATQPYAEAHFATFPTALVEPCIMAGSRPGDVVLDPFMGSGTVAQVAQLLGRKWLGCELSPDYIRLCDKRTAQPSLALA